MEISDLGVSILPRVAVCTIGGRSCGLEESLVFHGSCLLSARLAATLHRAKRDKILPQCLAEVGGGGLRVPCQVPHAAEWPLILKHEPTQGQNPGMNCPALGATSSSSSHPQPLSAVTLSHRDRRLLLKLLLLALLLSALVVHTRSL